MFLSTLLIASAFGGDGTTSDHCRAMGDYGSGEKECEADPICEWRKYTRKPKQKCLFFH